MGTLYKIFILIAFMFLGYFSHAQDCDPDLADPTTECNTAPIVCDLNNFCSTLGFLGGIGTITFSGDCDGWGIAINNPHWFSFIATATTVTVTIQPSNCLFNYFAGMQGAIITICPTGTDYATIGNCEGNSGPLAFTIGIGGAFVIGQQYWIMLDGFSGDICDYEIIATEGIQVPFMEDPSLITGPLEVCAGETATFTVDEPTFASTFYWVVDGAPIQSAGRTISYQIPLGTPNGTFEVCLSDAENACYNLVEDNGYVPNSICFEVEVVNLVPTVLPQVDICVEDAPYVWDGFSFFPPTSLVEIIFTSNRGCGDSIIIFDINWIEFEPEDQNLLTCEGEFPVFIPYFGNVFSPGRYFVDYTDLTYGCDSSYNVVVNEIIFDFDVQLDRFILECPGENIPIDASQTVVRLLPSGDVIIDFDYEWFLDGVSIGTDVFITAFEGGIYTFLVTANYDGVTCISEYEFEIIENFDIPEAPDMGPALSSCFGNIMEINILNWDFSNPPEITLFPGTCFTIISQDGPTIIIELDEACNDVLCVQLNKPGCPLLASYGCVNLANSAQLNPGLMGVDNFCKGGNTTLSGGAGFLSYTWSPGGQTTTSIVVNTPGLYSLVVEDANGCTGVQSIDVVENPEPTVNFSGSTAFCIDGSTTITVSQDNYMTYQWSHGSSGRLVVIDTEGTYTVTVTDAAGCTGEASFDIAELANPVPVISGDAAFCEGGSTVLTVGQTYARYTWSGPVSGTNPSLDVSQSGVYQVEVEDSFGCIGSGTFQVVVHPNPTPQIGGSTQYCVGLSTTLRGGNFVSWRWELAGGAIVTTQDIVVSTPGIYSLTVTDVNGCTGTSSVSVVEDDELTITLGGDDAFCAGLTGRVFVNGTFVDYNWVGPMAGLPNAGEIQVNVAGTYSVTVTDADGCTGRGNFTVIENLNPVPDISGPNSFCIGRTAMLDAGSGYTGYIWSTGAVTRTLSVTATGTYTVTVTDGNGCIGEDAIFVEELESLQPGFQGDPFFCAGASTQINVQSGYTRYTWRDDNSTNPQRTFSAPGTYVVEVEDADGCTGTGAIVIVENPLPVADAGVDQELTCRDNELTVGGSGTSAGNFSYSWREVEQGVSVSGTLRTLLVTEPGLYVLRVVNNTTGCEREDTVRVLINDDVIRSAEIEALDPMCFNETNGIIRVVSIDGGVGPFIYRINGGDMAQGVQGNLGPGQYRIFIEDSNGCTYEEVFILSNPAQVTVDAGPDILLEYRDAATVIPVTNIPESSIRNIRWEEGDLVLCDGCPTLELVVQPELAGTYRITVEDEFGCTATDAMRINLKRSRNVFIPSAFTPTANGINDRFTLYTGRDVINIKSLKVFDRWGNALYEVENIPPNDESYGWDGTFRGKEMDSAVFIYIAEVEFIDGEIFKYFGDVVLIK